MILELNNHQQASLKLYSVVLASHNLFGSHFHAPSYLAMSELKEIFGNIQLKKIK